MDKSAVEFLIKEQIDLIYQNYRDFDEIKHKIE